MRHEIAPRSGTAFTLDKGQRLTVTDVRGQQVADLLAYNRADVREVISAGRTFDYEERIFLTTGNRLWSNRSRPLLRIVADTCGRHDFLLTPCSRDTWAICYGGDHPDGPGCFGNLASALAPHGIAEHEVPAAFNCFMRVDMQLPEGTVKVMPPLSRAGDHVVFEALDDLVIGLTACSARDSNAGSFKPIAYEIA